MEERKTQSVSPGLAGLRAAAAALLACAVAAACHDNTTSPTKPLPAAVKPAGPDTLAGVVGTTLDTPLVVRVLDVNGNAIPGTSVIFSIQGPGTISPSTAVTNDSGVAAATFTFGDVAGSVVVSATDTTATPAVFYLTAAAGPPDSITVVSGDQQSGAAGMPLAAPLVVRVADQYGNPISGLTVTWSTSGAGSCNPATSSTDTNGQAQTMFTLDAAAGTQTVTARVTASLSATFTETGQ